MGGYTERETPPRRGLSVPVSSRRRRRSDALPDHATHVPPRLLQFYVSIPVSSFPSRHLGIQGVENFRKFIPFIRFKVSRATVFSATPRDKDQSPSFGFDYCNFLFLSAISVSTVASRQMRVFKGCKGSRREFRMIS